MYAAQAAARSDSDWATTCSPLRNGTLLTTGYSVLNPSLRFERRCAFWCSFKTVANVGSREPQLRLHWERGRTVAKLDAIGLLVRRCTQCSAG